MSGGERSFSLTQRYAEDATFALRGRGFLALALVPPNDIHHYIRILLTDVRYMLLGNARQLITAVEHTMLWKDDFIECQDAI